MRSSGITLTRQKRHFPEIGGECFFVAPPFIIPSHMCGLCPFPFQRAWLQDTARPCKGSTSAMLACERDVGAVVRMVRCGRVEDYPLNEVGVVVAYPAGVDQAVDYGLQHRHSRPHIGQPLVFVPRPDIDGEERQEPVSGFGGAEGLPPVPVGGFAEFLRVAVVVPPVGAQGVIHRPGTAWQLDVGEMFLCWYHFVVGAGVEPAYGPEG